MCCTEVFASAEIDKSDVNELVSNRLDQDVFKLDISMADAFAVHEMDGREQLTGDESYLLKVKLAIMLLHIF